MSKYCRSTIKQYERGALLQYTNKQGEVVEVSDNERQECEIFTRVMGYYRPTTEFNIGKKQEAKERAMYDQKYPEGVTHI